MLAVARDGDGRENAKRVAARLDAEARLLRLVGLHDHGAAAGGIVAKGLGIMGAEEALGRRREKREAIDALAARQLGMGTAQDLQHAVAIAGFHRGLDRRQVGERRRHSKDAARLVINGRRHTFVLVDELTLDREAAEARFLDREEGGKRAAGDHGDEDDGRNQAAGNRAELEHGRGLSAQGDSGVAYFPAG